MPRPASPRVARGERVMAVELVVEGSRVYLLNLPFAAKDRAKVELGMTGKNWDGDRRAWWVGLAKRAAAEKFVASLAAGGGVAVAEDPDKVRVVAKVKYKGRTYYARAVTDAGRARLTTLDMSVDFWADVVREGGAADGSGSPGVILKRYEPREEKHYGRPTGRMTYTTLGSIAAFIASKRREEEAVRSGDPHGGRTNCRGCHGPLDDAPHHRAMGGYCGNCAFDEFDC